MLGKLVAVVHGQRVDLFLEIIQRTYEHVGYVIGVLGEDWLDAGEATLPFDQGQQAPAPVAAHHQIDFPIADSGLFFDDGRTGIDRNAVGYRAFIPHFRLHSFRS